jgi:hypothetical protein
MRGTHNTKATVNGRAHRPNNGRSSPQGLTLPAMNMNMRMNIMRSRLKSGNPREVTERKQVGDAEGMVNEEGAGRNASSEGLEQL